MLDPRMAVQVALVLHELAENARRHGALAAPGRSAGGRLAGRGRPRGAAAALDWHEPGAAQPPPLPRRPRASASR